jgi:hypothetical protein
LFVLKEEGEEEAVCQYDKKLMAPYIFNSVMGLLHAWQNC